MIGLESPPENPARREAAVRRGQPRSIDHTATGRVKDTPFQDEVARGVYRAEGHGVWGVRSCLAGSASAHAFASQQP